MKLELLCNGLVVEVHPSLELGFIDATSGDKGVKGGIMRINRQGEVEEDQIFIDAVKSGDTIPDPITLRRFFEDARVDVGGQSLT